MKREKNAANRVRWEWAVEREREREREGNGSLAVAPSMLKATEKFASADSIECVYVFDVFSSFI